jgi:hypothetical protein
MKQLEQNFFQILGLVLAREAEPTGLPAVAHAVMRSRSTEKTDAVEYGVKR